MINPEEFDKALQAHSAWKQRLRDSINSGELSVSKDAASRDNNCEFGKWLYSLDASAQAGGHFTEVQKLHADFHKAVGKILDLAEKGNKLEAYNALSTGSEFATLSSKLSGAILNWKEVVLTR